MVTVHFVGPIKSHVGKPTAAWDFDTPMRVNELIDRLTGLYGQAFAKEVYAKSGEGFAYQILINGRNIFVLDGYRSEITDGDHVLISITMMGG